MMAVFLYVLCGKVYFGILLDFFSVMLRELLVILLDFYCHGPFVIACFV